MGYLFGKSQPELLKEETLPEIFAATAARYPDNQAIATERKTVTYRELSAGVDKLTATLSSNGIGRGSRVALLMPRGIEACTALLAVMKAGAAYAPIDPGYPEERCQFIVQDCQASAVITTENLAPRAKKLSGVRIFVSGDDGQILSADTSDSLPKASLEPGRPDDIAYIIYTSGTTGKPKGVPVTHRSACHFVRAEGSEFALDANASIYHGFSLAFDASIEELWLAWFCGAKLVIAPEEIARSGQDLNQWLIKQNVTVLSCVPTLLSLFDNDIPTLTLLILGGEVFPPALASRWTGGERRVANTYGPTEATVVATYALCESEKPVTLGRPLPNYIACVLDENLKPVKEGESGELCLGGPGLTAGYLNRPELNQTKFISAPDPNEPGAPDRLYRTGDRVSINAQGEIEFHGRVDDQVKLRGYRIELGEIEAALRDLPGVSQAAVAVREDSLGMSQLIGYLVPATTAGTTLEEATLRPMLRERLPAFMVPAFLEVIDKVPTLASGKIDRASLPAPKPREISELAATDEGFSEMESCLAGIWRKLFGTPTIGRDDNFFDLGGHSLLAARLASELRLKPGLSGASVVDVYRNPRLSDLALALQVEPSASKGQDGAQAQDSTTQTKAQKPKEVGPQAKWCCWTAQLLGLYIAFAIFSLQWYLPWFAFDYFEDSAHRAMYAGLLFLAIAFALEPVQMLICIALKWIFIGRYKEGDYPLWSFYYWRFWLVHSIYRLFSFANFEGTPFIPVFGRMMGASIGKDVYIGSACQFGDLIEIGDGASLNIGAELHFFRVEDGLLKLRRIRIGKNCDIGQNSLVEGGATMEDGSTLGPLSLLQDGAVLPQGQTWQGSPARAVKGKETAATETTSEAKHPATLFFLYSLSFLALAIFPLLAAVPGMLLLAWLDNNYDWQWSLLCAPVVCASFMFFFALQIVVAKRLLLGKVEAGRYELKSGFHMRYWFIDRLMHTSLDVLFPAYATLYLAPWLRLLGAKLDKRAEVSTIEHFTPDLLELGEEVFLADAVSVGAAHVKGGYIELAPVKVGAQSFVGNSAVIPGGTELGIKTLIGCLSMPPASKADCTRYDTSWMGSPPVFLPNRLINTKFSPELTYKPQQKLYLVRAVIELVRMILPGSVLIATSIVLMNMASEADNLLGTAGLLAVFPFFSVILGLVAAGFTIAMKWLVIGRYRAGESPLWSPFVWRSELVTALHDYLATPMLLSMLRGTPLLSWYFRALGAKIGASVYLDSTYMTEFDLIDIGSNCYINSDCDLQTHLFEDRVMKMSQVKLGDRCTVGAHSLILYDTNLADDTSLAPLSLVLKGERLSPVAGERWIGSPVQSEKKKNA